LAAPRPWIRVVAALALTVAALGACTRVWQARFVRPAPPIELDPEAAFVKCHMPDGGVYVFDHWALTDKRWISGTATQYGPTHEIVRRGEASLDLAEVALIETNRPQEIVNVGHVTVGVISVAAVAMGINCASSPKSCFGSCPTFYAPDGAKTTLQAEGFSASIARALEATDVDALASDGVAGGSYELRMTNEAYETHFVDSVEILSLPRAPGRQVVRAGDRFLDAGAARAPARCRGAGGDCRDLVAEKDGRELHSSVDAKDLAAPETVELAFDDVGGRRGVLLSARNSLVNTFLYYQLLAFMGRSANDWLLTLERAGPRGGRFLQELSDPLAHIVVSAADEAGRWREAGAFSEVGPIATDTEVVPLPGAGVAGRPLRVELRMARGSFRLDRAALVPLGEEVAPRVVAPARVRRLAKDGAAADAPAALAALAPGGEHLVTYPGDAYQIGFELPPGAQQLFLRSRGYYYEWMRKEWLADENPDEVRRFFEAPRDAFRRWAPAFARKEPEAERAFWTSRLRGTP
jgi:hypothetical protein